nr:hypothetical protein [Tessaracoccus coleopterorum]
MAITIRNPMRANRLPRLSASAGMSPASEWTTAPGSGVQGPSLGSTIFSVMTAATMAMTRDDATMK